MDIETAQKCYVHNGPCKELTPMRRRFYGSAKREYVLICNDCARILRKQGLLGKGKYAGLPCFVLQIPRVPDAERNVSLEIELTHEEVVIARARGWRVDKV